MVDITQLLLIIVITTLTILLALVGIQVVGILREFRRLLERVNKIMADAGVVSESFAKPFASGAGMVSGIMEGLKVARLVLERLRAKEDVSQEKGRD